MKAVVLYSPNDFKTVEDYPKPTIGPNDMLLEMKRTAICGTDIRILEGKKTKSVRYGHVIGHEISGVICEVGENVQGYQVGDRVAVENVIPDGSCAMCVSGHDNICLNRKAIGYEFDGGFAEYVLLPQEAIEGGNVVKLSDDVSFGEGALIEPLSCCLRGQKNAGVKFNDVVVIIGAGPIGLLAGMIAQAYGAHAILLDLVQERLDFAKELGIEYVINSGEEDAAARVSEITGGMMAQQVMECSGSNAAIRSSLDLVSNAGRITLTGWPPRETSIPTDIITRKEIDIRGARTSAGEFEEAIELIYTKKVDVAKILTKTISLDEAPETIRDIEKNPGNYMKVVVKVDKTV